MSKKLSSTSDLSSTYASSGGGLGSPSGGGGAARSDFAATADPAAWSTDLLGLQNETMRILQQFGGASSSSKKKKNGKKQSSSTTRSSSSQQQQQPAVLSRSSSGSVASRKKHKSSDSNAGDLAKTDGASAWSGRLTSGGVNSSDYANDDDDADGKTKGGGGASSSSFGKTRAQYTSASSAPSTVEVLQQSDPSSKAVWDGYDTDEDAESSRRESEARATRQSIERQNAAERDARTLDFGAEEGRVRASVDRFVPLGTGGATVGGGSQSVKTSDLDDERRRLDKIEEAVRRRRLRDAESSREGVRRTAWLADDVSATRIQNVVRANIAKWNVKLRRLLKERETTNKSGWIEVRDQDRGEVWYYNQLSGLSTWSRPSDMKEFFQDESKIKKLPPLAGGGDATNKNNNDGARAATSGKHGYQSQHRSVDEGSEEKKDDHNNGGGGTLPAINNAASASGGAASASNYNHGALSPPSKLPRVKGAEEDDAAAAVGLSSYNESDDEESASDDYEDEEDDDYDLSDMESERDRLFLADGTVNAGLRHTIEQTLRVSRFDSMSTLLASGGAEPTAEDKRRVSNSKKKKKKKMAQQQQGGGQASHRPIFLHSNDKRMMVSIVRIKGLSDSKNEDAARTSAAAQAASDLLPANGSKSKRKKAKAPYRQSTRGAPTAPRTKPTRTRLLPPLRLRRRSSPCPCTTCRTLASTSARTTPGNLDRGSKLPLRAGPTPTRQPTPTPTALTKTLTSTPLRTSTRTPPSSPKSSSGSLPER